MQRLVSVEQLFIIASAYCSNMKMAWQVQSQVSPLNAVLDPDSPVDLHNTYPYIVIKAEPIVAGLPD